MPDAPLNKLSWFGIDKPTLGYRTNTSPIDESPHWVAGSSNAISTIKGEMEKRPGFAEPIETLLSAIPGTVTRLFTWRRFSGSFFVMASVTTGVAASPSEVWKLEVDHDQSFVKIYADTSSTSAYPFDFTTSNNFCFFGNGTTRGNMRKFDGTRVTLWGLDAPLAPPAIALVSPTLPPGLTFNGTTLSGTPTTPGTYGITFTATDAAGDTATTDLTFTISAATLLEWTTPSGSLPFATLGTPYNLTLGAWGGTAPYTFAIVSGTLPAGLSLANGTISGTPTAVGEPFFVVQLTDGAGTVLTRQFSLFVGDPTVTITPPSTSATVGAAYTSAVTASGGTSPYVFTVSDGRLPGGLSLDPSSGAITGTPSISGTFTVTFSVADATGITNRLPVTFTVSSNVLAVAATPAPPEGKVGYPYTFTPFASGGSASISSTSGAQQVSGDWEFVGNQYRTHFEPAVTALSDLVFLSFTTLSSIPPTATILGITVSAVLVSEAATAGVLSQVALYSAGAVLGTIKTPNTPFTATLTPATYGSSTDLWGNTTISATAVASPTFGFAMAVNLPDTTRLFIGEPFTMTVTYTDGSGAITLIATPDAITAQTGYLYGQTYTSVYGHESSMSPLSPSTGIFSTLDVRANVIASGDPQVTGINIYRTTDGGDADPAAMRLLASLPNANAAYFDSTQDVYLGTQTGPALYVNNPPQPLSGFVWSNGRIWGRTGSYTWFTGNEEVTNGIPAECMSNAANGNFYDWPAEVGGMSVTSNGVNIGLPEQFWQISGDTLATFRKSKLLQGGGTRYPPNITTIGDATVWMDTSHQLFSSSDGEFGEPIRPDFTPLDLSQTFVLYHKSLTFNWVVVLDALNGQLFVFDNDLKQWHTPWVLPAPITSITSGETGVGQIDLLLAFASGHVMRLTPGSYLDDGQPYADQLKISLLPIVPGRGTTARNTAEVRRVFQIDMEVSMRSGDANDFLSNHPDAVGVIVDDDPAQSTFEMFSDLTGNIAEPQYQDQTIQKRFIAPRRWMVDQSVPQGRRVAFFARWNADAKPWALYSADVAWWT